MITFYIFDNNDNSKEAFALSSNSVKTVEITQNGVTEILPDAGSTMERVDITANVPNPSTGTIFAISNGTYNVKDYATLIVNVPNPSIGTRNITSNGQYDVSTYASAEVDVPNPSTGTLTVTSNGTYDVTNYAWIQVDVYSVNLNAVVQLDPPEDTTKLWLYGSEGSNTATFSGILRSPRQQTAFTRELLGVSLDSTQNRPMCVAHGDYIYCFGGMFSNKIAKYSTLNNTVSYVYPALPLALYGSALISHGDYIYIFGGVNSDSETQTTIYKFNCTNDTFTTISANMPKGLYLISANEIGGTCYISGGWEVSGGSSFVSQTIYRFYYESETIDEYPVSTGTMGGASTASVSVGNFLYLFVDTTRNIIEIDINSQSKQVLSNILPQSINGPVIGRLNDKVYLVGSYPTGNVIEFDPSEGTAALVADYSINRDYGCQHGDYIYTVGFNATGTDIGIRRFFFSISQPDSPSVDHEIVTSNDKNYFYAIDGSTSIRTGIARCCTFTPSVYYPSTSTWVPYDSYGGVDMLSYLWNNTYRRWASINRPKHLIKTLTTSFTEESGQLRTYVHKTALPISSFSRTKYYTFIVEDSDGCVVSETISNVRTSYPDMNCNILGNFLSLYTPDEFWVEYPRWETNNIYLVINSPASRHPEGVYTIKVYEMPDPMDRFGFAFDNITKKLSFRALGSYFSPSGIIRGDCTMSLIRGTETILTKTIEIDGTSVTSPDWYYSEGIEYTDNLPSDISLMHLEQDIYQYHYEMDIPIGPLRSIITDSHAVYYWGDVGIVGYSVL